MSSYERDPSNAYRLPLPVDEPVAGKSGTGPRAVFVAREALASPAVLGAHQVWVKTYDEAGP